jgi:hypothetical protein
VLRSLKYETLELSNLECLPGHALDALEAVEPEGSVAGEGAAVILHLGAGSTVRGCKHSMQQSFTSTFSIRGCCDCGAASRDLAMYT